jgi:hypothetical protein
VIEVLAHFLADIHADAAQELKSLEEQMKVASETMGDIEQLDAMLAKEKFFMRIGNKAEAFAAAEEVSPPSLCEAG